MTTNTRTLRLKNWRCYAGPARHFGPRTWSFALAWNRWRPDRDGGDFGLEFLDCIEIVIGLKHHELMMGKWRPFIRFGRFSEPAPKAPAAIREWRSSMHMRLARHAVRG